MMNIALDAMGGDHAPHATVAGAVDAARHYDVTISLVGQSDMIRAASSVTKRPRHLSPLATQAARSLPEYYT